MRLPPLNALRAFDAAARHLSFKGAAAELCVTPGAVSQHVANLEQFLGVHLFVRRNREVVLTPQGQGYLHDVREGFERIARATSLLSSVTNEKTLRVKLPPTCAARWLVPRLAKFHAQYPDIHVQLSTSHDVVDLDDEDVDLAILYSAGIGEGQAGLRLFDEVLIPVCSPSIAAAMIDATPSELAKCVLLHSSRRPYDWSRWFASAGLSDDAMEKEIIFENSTLTLQGAIDGLGVAIAQKAFVEIDLAAGRLVSPVSVSLQTEFGYFAVCAKGKLRYRKNRVFQAWLATEVSGSRH